MEGESKVYKKGMWSKEEDNMLIDYVQAHGSRQWNRIPKVTGLKRSGKSCRSRWMNYLSPDVKHGEFSEEEDDLIIRLHKLLGKRYRWSLIAGRIPGRTEKQIRSHWNTNLKKKLLLGEKNERARESKTNLPAPGNQGGQKEDQEAFATSAFGVGDIIWSPATDFNDVIGSEEPPHLYNLQTTLQLYNDNVHLLQASEANGYGCDYPVDSLWQGLWLF